MQEIEFYRTINGKSPVEEYLNTLDNKTIKKIWFVLRIVKELETIPVKYLKHLELGIYEVRVQHGNNEYRFLCFFHVNNIVVLTNGFTKKSQKTPKVEIETAIKRRNDFLQRKRG